MFDVFKSPLGCALPTLFASPLRAAASGACWLFNYELYTAAILFALNEQIDVCATLVIIVDNALPVPVRL